MEIIIKPASKKDIPVLSQLSADTFYQTYADYNTEEDMQMYVLQNFSIEALEKNFEEPNAKFFIAWNDDEAVAYCKLRTVEEPVALRGLKHLELERIYVKQEWKRVGIGKRLLQTCIDFAKQKNFDVLWLGVWEHNQKALDFYTKMGFEIFGDHIFKLGNDEQKDYLMKLELK